jgi:hypothetical protein
MVEDIMKFEGDLEFIQQIKEIIKEQKKDNVAMKIVPKEDTDHNTVFLFIYAHANDTHRISDFIIKHHDKLFDNIFVVDHQMIVIKKFIKQVPELTQHFLRIEVMGQKKLNKITNIISNHSVHAVLEWSDIIIVNPIIKDYYKENYDYESVAIKVIQKNGDKDENQRAS